ncbi:MAG: hypothetical protein KGN36_10195, partial [Acidobacteriota bacterium]|nr:hypothetical protein [Acidobacteriota bacterium]
LALGVLLHDLSFEPAHPQILVLLALMLSCVLSLNGGRAAMLAMGAIGAVLLFTKINTGVFYLMALGFTLACRLPAPRARRLLTAAGVLFAAAFPALLMRHHLPAQAAWLCLLATVSLAGAFFAARLSATQRPDASAGPPTPLYAAIGFAAGAAAITVTALLTGVPLPALMEGVLWGPLRHPGVYAVLMEVSPLQALFAVAAVAFTLALHLLRPRWQHREPRLRLLVCAAGIVAVPILALATRDLAWLLPLLPLGLLWPCSNPPAGDLPCFLTCLSAAEFLQVYPIRGTQAAIAAAPLLLWAFLCIARGSEVPAGPSNPARAAVPGGALLLAFAALLLASGQCALSYPDPPSGLRGASWLHLPAPRAAAYRTLASQIRANCAILFTLPGMGSFNLWAGVPPPNGMNLTAWVRDFTPLQQQGILDILRNNPRSCAVYSPVQTAGWQNTARDLDSPLARYITGEMPPAFEALGYQIRVHPRRDTPWTPQPPDTAAGDRP